MAKLLIGFLLGVVVTLAAMQLLRAPAPDGETLPAAGPLANAGTESTLQTNGGEAHSASAGPAEPQDRAVRNRDKRRDPASLPEAVQDGTFVATSNPAAVATPPTGSASNTGSGAAVPPGAGDNSSYPPEIAEMLEKSVDKELQAQYENDEREDSWAPYMEGLLGAYFAQKPSLSQFYISLIDCRTSICSMHAIGYGPEALTQWNVGTADLVNQPWFEFNNMSMNRRNPAPDVLAVVLILTKPASP